MKKFKELKKTGDGTFGVVIKAEDTQTHDLVAIKKMKQKYHNFDECTNLREVKALLKLQNHPNIVKLKEIFLDNDTLCLVFEFVEKSIYQMYTQQKEMGKIISEDQIKSIIYQVANGLSYMHKHGYFHRDLKPENMLLTNNGIVKIIDLGCAREIRSRPPYTDYIATRWYRAPEILLKQANYNSPVDIFALGCIMAELFLNRPLFQGNSELEQFNKILSTLGTFTQQEWPEGCRLVSQMGLALAQFQPLQLQQLIPNASTEAINLLTQMIRWDPNKRITAAQMLTHPFFYNIEKIAPSLIFEEQNKQKDELKFFESHHKAKSYSQKDEFQTQFKQKQQLQQKIKDDDSNDLDDILDFITTENKPMPSKLTTQSAKTLDFNEYIPSSQTLNRQPRNLQSSQLQEQNKKENNSIYDFSHLQSFKPNKQPNLNSKYQ
ncbi:unnamed protein product [Paramecium pentaurelia]|uniref:Protein kinase domain-containing protein n=1 Tax=Paramecium pentaurelia TaxID=43138 RepID=A0A8S1Y418_9CILI|nr:unnamed protein product [Paramecium pentaurelia]